MRAQNEWITEYHRLLPERKHTSAFASQFTRSANELIFSLAYLLLSIVPIDMGVWSSAFFPQMKRWIFCTTSNLSLQISNFCSWTYIQCFVSKHKQFFSYDFLPLHRAAFPILSYYSPWDFFHSAFFRNPKQEGRTQYGCIKPNRNLLFLLIVYMLLLFQTSLIHLFQQKIKQCYSRLSKGRHISYIL